MPTLIEAIEAVSFDLDGTLVDTAPDLAAAANMMLAILGGRPLLEEHVPMLIGAGIDELVAKALASSGVSAEPARHAMAAALFRNLYGQRLFHRSHVYPGVLMTLHSLRAAGRTLYCVTNKERKFALPLLEAAGLSGFFTSVFCPDRPEDRKPSPALLLAACMHACVEPAKMLCVGDSRTDIAMARAAGCRIVAVDYGYHHGLSLEELRPDAIVSDVRQILELNVRPKNGDLTMRAIA